MYGQIGGGGGGGQGEVWALTCVATICVVAVVRVGAGADDNYRIIIGIRHGEESEEKSHKGRHLWVLWGEREGWLFLPLGLAF